MSHDLVCVGMSPLRPAHPRCAVMTSGTSRRRFPLPPRGCSSLEQALTHLSCSGRTYPVVSGGGPLLPWQHQVSQCHQLVDNCWMAKGLLRVLSAWMVEGSAVGVLVLVYWWHSSLWVGVSVAQFSLGWCIGGTVLSGLVYWWHSSLWVGVLVAQFSLG